MRNRKKKFYIPLFSGYLFLFGEEAERLKCLRTNRVVQSLSIDDEETLRNDLLQLRRLIASDVPLTVERRICAGESVRIKSGPLEALEGKVSTRRGQNRLMVFVNFLQQGASIQIEDFLVEPV